MDYIFAQPMFCLNFESPRRLVAFCVRFRNSQFVIFVFNLFVLDVNHCKSTV